VDAKEWRWGCGVDGEQMHRGAGDEGDVAGGEGEGVDIGKATEGVGSAAAANGSEVARVEAGIALRERLV